MPLEIAALAAGKSIVVAPRRFIVPGKRFLLVPASEQAWSLEASLYRPEALDLFEADGKAATEQLLGWVRCEFCQHITGTEGIADISQLTLWNEAALTQGLRNQGNLFLAVVRFFKLEAASALQLDRLQNRETLNTFVPLPNYLDVSEESPVLGEEDFQQARRIFTSRDVKRAWLQPEKDAVPAPEEASEIEVEPPVPAAEPSVAEPSILERPDWFTKITEVGNSSDGYTFEKLVRKSFVELGFENSGKYAAMSLDPSATGGSGGLDLYCDTPYPVVGECKATKSDKVRDNSSGPATQLIRLGQTHLGNSHYQECIKIIFAAGELTMQAQQSAQQCGINVIRPESLQRLMELKSKYPNAFTLSELRDTWANPPFSEEANQQLDRFVDEVWNRLKLLSLMVEAVRKIHETEPVQVLQVETAFNILRGDEGVSALRDAQEVRDKLIELSSPLTGYLGRDRTHAEDRFYFLRSLKIEN